MCQTRSGWRWDTLVDVENGDPKEWLFDFSNNVDLVGIKNVTVEPEDIDKPEYYFRLVFPDQAIELMCDETNRYANQMRLKDFSPQPRKRKWEDCDVVLIKAFIGLQIAMGMCEKGAEVDQWQVTFWLNTTPYIKELESSSNKRKRD